MDLSPDGKTLALASVDTVRLWDTATGALLGTYRHKGLIHHLAFSPKGGLLAISTEDQVGTVRLVDPNTWEELHAFSRHREGANATTALAFAPHGMALAWAFGDGLVRLWTTTEERPWPLIGHSSRVLRVVFSADSKMVAAVSEDLTVMVWATENRRLQRAIEMEPKASSTKSAAASTGPSPGFPLKGLCVLVTGTMPRPYKQPEVKTLLKSFGARVATSPNDNPDLVICGANPASKTKNFPPSKVMQWETLAARLGLGYTEGDDTHPELPPKKRKRKA